MKYAPPIGSIDPNAGYVDRSGNTPGSPVPAAAIEPVMREIENVIVKAGLMPSGSDFTQLWQAIAGRTRIPATNNITVYVRTDGNDANSGLADSTAGAFRTVQAAVDNIRNYDMRGHSYVVLICPGTYGEVFINRTHESGQSGITVKGKTPGTVTLQGTGQGHIFLVRDGMVGVLSDVTLKVSTNMNTCCVLAYNGGYVQISNIIFDGTAVSKSSAVAAEISGYVLYTAGGNLTLKGTFANAFSTDANGYMYLYKDLTITFSDLTVANNVVSATRGGVALVLSTMAGAETVKGKKYGADTGGVITTNNAGINYIPGTIAGSTSNGGVYA